MQNVLLALATLVLGGAAVAAGLALLNEARDAANRLRL